MNKKIDPLYYVKKRIQKQKDDIFQAFMLVAFALLAVFAILNWFGI